MRQSTPIVAREGITLSFSEPLACVGASVTPSIGSTNSGRSGSFARSASSAAAPSVVSKPEVAQQRERPLGHVEVRAGRRPSPAAAARASAARCRRCAGCSRGPPAPCVVSLKRWTPFSATQTPYRRPPSYGMYAPAPSLSRKSQRTRSGWFSVSQIAPSAPPTSSSTTATISRSPRAGRQPFARERDAGGDLGRRLRLHVERAAAPQLAVDHVAAPRVVLPLARVREHRVDVGEQAQRRAVGLAAQAGDEIRALLEPPDERHLEAGVAQRRGELLLRRTLVARRVDGVVPDEPREQRGRLRLQVGHAPMLPADPVTRSRAG